MFAALKPDILKKIVIGELKMLKFEDDNKVEITKKPLI